MRTIIQAATGNIEASINFYKKLGFQITSTDKSFFASDRSVSILINTDHLARPGFIFLKDNWNDEINKLKPEYYIHNIEHGYKLGDGNGNWIFLLDEMHYSDFVNSTNKSILGNYAGISIECANIQQSLSLYGILGFKKTGGDIDQGWLSLKNNGTTVSLMTSGSCPHLFFNPSITYFNGKDNLKIIENIRSAGIPITQEITHFNKEGVVDNIILSDPGGLGIFIYSD